MTAGVRNEVAQIRTPEVARPKDCRVTTILGVSSCSGGEQSPATAILGIFSSSAGEQSPITAILGTFSSSAGEQSPITAILGTFSSSAGEQSPITAILGTFSSSAGEQSPITVNQRGLDWHQQAAQPRDSLDTVPTDAGNNRVCFISRQSRAGQIRT
jgi:hypothetical protein